MRDVLGAGGDVLLDANLLLLLLVGACDREAVGVHNRLSAYKPPMVDLLAAELAEYRRIVVTPNVLTEVSNLSTSMHARLRSGVYQLLAIGTTTWDEVYVPSAAAVQRPEFSRLGLTDAVLLTLKGRAITLFTADAMLCDAAWRVGLPAVNFWHRAAALL